MPDTTRSAKQCDICTSPATSICAGCRAAQYCSRTCQKQDWGSGHKQICAQTNQPSANNIVNLVCKGPKPGTPEEMFGVINLNHGLSMGMPRPMVVTPPVKPDRTASNVLKAPNVHGNQKFIVKVQTSQANMPIMIYDQQRSFQTMLYTDSPGYAQIYQIITRNTRWGGIKAFIRVTRAHEEELAFNVYVDEVPSQEQTW